MMRDTETPISHEIRAQLLKPFRTTCEVWAVLRRPVSHGLEGVALA